MDAKNLKIHIANALDLLQIVTEDIEENVMCPQQTAYMSKPGQFSYLLPNCGVCLFKRRV